MEGRYVIAGHVGGLSLKNINIVVVEPQNLLASRLIEVQQTSDHQLTRFKKTSQGGYLMFGKIKIPPSSVYDTFMSKINDGLNNVVWKVNLGISGTETECMDFIESSSANTIYVVSTIDEVTYKSIQLIEISNDGQTILWRRKYRIEQDLQPF